MKFFDASRYASPLRKALAKKENAPRNLRFETLENRALLSVTPLDELQAAVSSAEIAPQTVETPVVDLSVLAVSNATAENVVETEPNDSFETAQDLGLLTQTTKIDAVAGAYRNADYYKVSFNLAGTEDNSIVLENAWVKTEHGTINLQLYLYDANGVQKGYSTGMAATETISLNGLPAGDYYILVGHYDGAAFNHAGEASYSLTITPPALESDGYANQTLETARDLGVLGQTTAEGKTGLPNEYDYFKFSTATTGAEGDFVKMAYAQAVNANLAFALLDADGNEIENNALNATTKTISLQDLPAGDYYLRVHNADAGANKAIDYAIEVQATVAAPAAPTNFKTDGSEATNNYATLSWDNVFGETGYELQVSVNDGDWTTVETFAADATTSGKLDLAFATKYQYRLRAVNATDADNVLASAWVELDAFTTVAAPEPPQELAAAPLVPETLTTVLTWDDLANELGYVVDLLDADGVSLLESPVELDADTTSWTTPPLAIGTTYKFQITALNNAGDATAELTFTTENVPNAPAGLKATVADAAETSATLTWNAATETGAEAVVAYVVTYTDGQTVLTQTVDVATAENPTTCQLLNLIKGATYDVTVVAVNAYGDSAAATVKFSTLETPSTVVTTLSDVVDKYDGEISLREAIAYAEADATLGTTITFDAEAYADELDADGKATIVLGGTQLTVSKALTIDGGENGVTIDANQKSRVLRIVSTSAPSAFKNLTLINGRNTSKYGAGGVTITTDSKATFENVTISGNSTTTDYSGGVYLATRTTAVFTNVTISQNTGGKMGGGVYVDPYAKSTFTNVEISGNTAETYGGGVYVAADATATFTNVEISGNTAKTSGGGVYVMAEVTTTFTNADISGNTAKTSGAGVYVYNGTVKFIDSKIAENTVQAASVATYGGGVYLRVGTANFTNVELSQNTANSTGGSAYGGGVYVSEGTARFTNAKIAENTVNSTVGNAFGGGVYVKQGTARFTNASLSKNIAGANADNGLGGGLCLAGAGNATLTNVEISENTANNGGGVRINGSASFVNTTITENTANNGGGVDVKTGATATFNNATIAGNVATTETGAAGVYGGGTTTIYNSILAGNTGVDFVDGGTSKAYNTLSSFTAWDNASATQYVYDETQPLFTDAENGDYTLAAGSQAINKGADSYVADSITTDLAGNPRFNGTVDAGAYENQLPFAPTDLAATVLNPETLTVDLTWTDVAGNETGYVVETLVDGAWVAATEETLAADAQTWTTGKLELGTTYAYRVAAVNDYGQSDWATLEFTTENVPAQPTGLTATINPSLAPTATLTWDADENATAYEVTLYQIVVDADGETTIVAFEPQTVADATYTTGTLDLGGVYYFEVAAKNVYGKSEVATSKTFTVGVAPAQPTDLEYEFNHYANNVILTWTAVEGADAYVVEQLGADGEWTPVAPPVGNPETTETTWESGVFDFGTSRAFRVVAKNAYGSSVASDAVSFTIQDEPTVVTSLEDGELNLLDDVTTLREALRFAQDGATITFAEDLRGGTITLTGGPLSIMEKEISVRGFVDETGAPELTIDGDHKDMIFVVANTRASFFGLTVVNGYASYAKYGGGALGGGFSVDNANASFTNVDVIGCCADVYGGGIYIASNVEAPGQGKSTLTNVRILDNVADNGESSGLGGGLYATGGFMGGEIEMTNVEISGNQARADGGGVFLNDITSTLTNVKITDNIAQGNGGAFYANAPDHTFISNLTGYPLLLISTKLTNVEISGNQAYNGFGFYADGFDVEELSLRNVTLADNVGTQEGASADVYLANGAATFYNSIVDGDVQGEEYAANAYNTLSNFTAWANAGEEGVVNYVLNEGDSVFAEGSYALAADSVALNKGDDAYVAETLATDLAGNARISGTNVDLGAYEYQGVAPQAPTGLTATVNASTAPTATLTWNAVKTATSYVVALFDADGEIVATETVAATEWTTGTLELGASYAATVVAVNAYGESAATEAVEFAVGNVPSVPNALTFGAYDVETGRLEMSWNNVEDETRYRVEASGNGGVWFFSQFTKADVTERVASIKYDLPYSFRVRAENAYGESAWVENTFVPTPYAPSDLTARLAESENPTVTLTWTDKSKSETGFVVEVLGADGQTWETAATLGANAKTWTSETLVKGATYAYRVVVVNSVGQTATEAVEFTVGDVPTQPTGLKATVAPSAAPTATLTWDAVETATSYVVALFDADGEIVATETVAATKWTTGTLELGASYAATVVAVNAYGESAATEAVEFTVGDVPAQPTDLTATVAPSAAPTATLTWVDAANNETGYVVEQLVGENWKTVVELEADATKWTTGILDFGALYQYRVVAVNAYGQAATEAVEVEIASALVAPNAIEFGAYDAETGKLEMRWDDVEGETRYRVEASVDGGKTWFFSQYTAANDTDRVATIVYTDRPYSFRVRAENANGASEWTSATFTPPTAVVPTAPTAITFGAYDAATGKLEMSWDDVEGEKGYRVEASVDGGKTWFFSQYLGADQTERVATIAYTDRSYSFRVRAENRAGVSEWTEGKFLPPSAPLPTQPGAIEFGAYDPETGKLEMSWGNSENETGYRVEASVDGGKTWFFSQYLGADQTNRVATIAYPQHAYSFRVRAENSYDVSDWTTATFVPSTAQTGDEAVSSAKLTSDFFANAFDEADFFVDEEDFDALAKRLS